MQAASALQPAWRGQGTAGAVEELGLLQRLVIILFCVEPLSLKPSFFKKSSCPASEHVQPCRAGDAEQLGCTGQDISIPAALWNKDKLSWTDLLGPFPKPSSSISLPTAG